jgi:hypothetical protein
MFNALRDNFPQNTKLALSLTGGGASFFDSMIAHGGSSRFFSLGRIPYDELVQDLPKGVKSVSARYTELENDKLFSELSKYWMTHRIITVTGTFALMKLKGERPDRLNRGYIGIEEYEKCNCLSYAIYYFEFDKQKLYERYLQESSVSQLVCQVIAKHTYNPNADLWMYGIHSINEVGNQTYAKIA